MTAQRSQQPPRRDLMADYVPVNERIAAFYAKHPEGSIQSELVELTDTRVVMRAYAYRKPDDERPGIGYSSMNIPGSTSFTRGSEIENTETSAWGRAIAALGFEVKRGIATAEEVENKREEPASRAPKPAERPATPRVTPIRSTTTPPEPDEDAVAELYAAQMKEKPAEEPWNYARFRLAMAELPTNIRPDKPKLVRIADRLFPTKDLPLAEPKVWTLNDREWRQLAEVLAVPE